MVFMLLGVALAGEVPTEPPSVPEGLQTAPMAQAAPPLELRGQRLHRAGNITGIAGAGGVVAGTAMIIGAMFCETGDCAVTSLTSGVLVLGVGSLAVEVGAPMALVGAEMGRNDVGILRGERVPATGTIVGWSCFGSQILLGPALLPGAYIGAAAQQSTNKRWAQAGVGVKARW